ncbi:hypothetical protein R1flu_015893 [Riccia fluitans]|uniref:Uncharacterized protein n=1 Tax=Riccia fluitans TaxID=41844 RepID=A0ABD1YP57_9MARC
MALLNRAMAATFSSTPLQQYTRHTNLKDCEAGQSVVSQTCASKVTGGLRPSTVSLTSYGTRAAHRFFPRSAAASQEGLFLEEEGEWKESIDPGIFEEVFPSVRKQEKEPKVGSSRSSSVKLVESTTKSILIPEEWVPVQKHHLRSKKERKQETLALQIQRAREREAEVRALKEAAASEARARLYSSVYFNPDASAGSGTPGVDAADCRPEVILEELVEAEEKVSGRARPKDYRVGLEFLSLEDVAEKLREVVKAGNSSTSSKNDGECGDEIEEEEEDEARIVVELTLEEKEMLRTRNLNFAKISSKSWSPLHTLAAAGQVYLAAELIKRGAQVDALDKEGLTPLHRAIQGGRKTMVRLLLKAGANAHVRDKDGATLLHYAAQTGNRDIAKLVHRDDVNVNAADKDGWTPLHVAVQTGRTELIRWLINRGADFNRVNSDGNSPYDLSLSFGNCFKFYDMIKFMKSKEVEMRTRSKPRGSQLRHDELM